MTNWTKRQKGSLSKSWRRKSSTRLAVAAILSVAQAQTALAAIVNIAIATGDYQGTLIKSNEVSASVDVVASAPSLMVQKSSVENDVDNSSSQSAGDSVVFSVSVENNGNVSLTGPSVTDDLVSLAYQSGDTDGDGEIDPDEVWQYSATYTLTQDDIDTNGGGDGFVESLTTVNVDQITEATTAEEKTAINNLPAMTLSSTATLNDDDGVVGLSAGDTVTYQVVVDNSGNTTLTSISMNETLANVVLASGDDGDDKIAPSETWTYSGTYTITQQDIDTNGGGDGAIEFLANVGASEVATAQTNDDVAISQIPVLTVNKTGTYNDDDGVAGYTAGDTVDYVVTVENSGNQSITNVEVTDPLVAVTLSSGDTNSDNILNVDESWTYTGTYTITQTDLNTNGGGDGDIDNSVTVKSDQTTDRVASFALPINSAPGLNVVLSETLNDDDGNSGLTAGDTISYELSVANTGNQTLTSLSITEALSQSGSTWANTIGQPTGDTNSDGILDVGETWVYGYSTTLLQDQINDGNNLVDTVNVSTDQITADAVQATTTLPTGSLVSSYVMAASGVLNDGDSDGKADVNETIDYTFAFTNTGNQSLINLKPVSTMPGLSAISCNGDVDGDGDVDLINPGASVNCTASYTVTQQDIEQDQPLVNTVTTVAETALGSMSVAEDDSANDNSVSTDVDARAELIVTTNVEKEQLFPTRYQVTYTINMENAGTVLLDNLTAKYGLVEDLSPGTLISGPSVDWSNFTGAGSLNSGYNGGLVDQLLSGDVQLAPGSTGEIVLTYVVETDGQEIELGGSIEGGNGSTGTVTPDENNGGDGTGGGIGGGELAMVTDTDHDMATDGVESMTADRDGDGVSDAEDFDPTGYFYCQADGSILSGGQISITNLQTGGVQTGVGKSNDITIVSDGSTNGYYQWYVHAAGRYEMTYQLPSGGVASTTLQSSGELVVSPALPTNPYSIGSNEFSSTGKLGDYTAASNPFFTTFEFQSGGPVVLNNNIPLELCSDPKLMADAQLVSEPQLGGDGKTTIEYMFTAANDGLERIENAQIEIDLDAVFGAGNYSVLENSISQPTSGTFAGTSVSSSTMQANPFFNGSSNSMLLTSGITLEPNQSISVSVLVKANVEAGSYPLTMAALGEAPRDSSALSASDVVSIQVIRAGSGSGLAMTKTASVDEVSKGQSVGYTLTLDNTNAAAANGVTIVDELPAGFRYQKGSAKIGSTQVDPEVEGKRLYWRNLTAPASGKVIITLTAVVGAATSGTEFTNYAYGMDATSGARVTNIAKAVVDLRIEPMLDCSTVIGRVFEDLDHDGKFDKGEPGIAGARLATVNGELITADRFGRYSVPCAMIPDDRIGSNYILKLDERSLPFGYSATSENPRVIRLTKGKMSKMNFGVAGIRVVSFELTEKSFAPGSSRLSKSALQQIAESLPMLEEQETLLKITYDERGASSSKKKLGRKRVKMVEQLIEKAWESKARPYDLEIQSRHLN